MIHLHHGEFLGREIGRTDARSFVVTFRRSGNCEIDAAPHCHCNPHILLPLDAGYWSQADDFDDGNPLQLFYTPSGTEHRDSMARLGGRYLSISVENPVVENLSGFPASPVALRRPHATRLAHRLAVDNASGDADSLSVEDACFALLHEIVPRQRHSRRRPPRWLKSVAEICHTHNDIPSISAIGAKIGIHPFHVSRVFRERYGVPLSRYILALKIERAALALRTSASSVATIAADCAFSDQSHLNKSFKAALGINPSQYRSIFA